MSELRANPSTLAAVLKAAKPGDRIVLAQNRLYGDVTLPPADHAEPVEIDAAGAKLRTLTIRGTSGWRWQGGLIEAPEAANRALLVIEAKRIGVAGVRFDGGLNAGQVIYSSDVMLRGNIVTGMVSDGFDIAASQRVGIVGNTITDFASREAVWKDGVLIKDAPHADGIQLWSLPGREPTSDVLILGNRIHGRTQGIAHFWHVSQNRPKAFRVTVERNEVTVPSAWGIGMLDVEGAVVRWNTVRTLANERGLKARIFTAADAVVEGNEVS